MHPGIRSLAGLAGSLLACCAVLAQAPGEDPVVLRNKQSVQMLPVPAGPKSQDIDRGAQMPDWMRARVTRYTARAFSEDTSGILTDNDVVTTSTAQGQRRTCVQEIGSTTTSGVSPGMKYGPGNNNQVVVLRGDLVNICN